MNDKDNGFIKGWGGPPPKSWPFVIYEERGGIYEPWGIKGGLSTWKPIIGTETI